MTRVCVVGSVNTDLTFAVDAMPRPGDTVLTSALTSTPGGKGANQAVAAARAGAQVQFVGAVGTDSGADALLSHLHANDVGTDVVITVPGPSGTAAIIVDANAENMIVVAPGANAHLVLDSATIRNVIANSDVVLLQLEIPIATEHASPVSRKRPSSSTRHHRVAHRRCRNSPSSPTSSWSTNPKPTDGGGRCSTS